jgi:fructokinase
MQVLGQLIAALDPALKIYDVNLRPEADSLALVTDLLQQADVVKLNDQELARVQAFTGLTGGIEAFCRSGRERYGWLAVAVTRGEQGCAMLVGDSYVEVPGIAVTVADTVGAGDAFAAALVHGLSQGWPAEQIAGFANRAGADVASRAESLPVVVLS